MERTHYEEQNLRLYIRELKIYVQSNYYWDTKLESTVRYLGIEVDDALEMAEETEV